MSVQTQARIRDPAPLLWIVAGAAWTVAGLLTLLGGAALASHDHIIEHSTSPWVVRIAAFLVVWTVMIAAMMLPTTISMTRLFVVVSARAPHPFRARAVLALAYLAVWAGFGLVAVTGDRGVHAVVDRWPWLEAHSGLILAGTLAIAGGFQFSGLKDRCLTACRDPMGMLWQHYRRGVGVWRLGWHHALNCLGCCWALMLLMFGVGASNLAWMLGLTVVMVAEKTTRWGRRLITPVGLGLLIAAVVLALAAFGIAPFAPAFSRTYG